MEKISFSEYAFLKFYIFAAPYSVIWIKSSQLAAQKVNKTERGVSKKENEKGKLWTKTSVIFSFYFDGSSVKMHNMHQVKTEFKNEKMHKETRAYIWLYLSEWNRNSSCQHSRFSAALVTVSLDYVTLLKICKGLKNIIVYNHKTIFNTLCYAFNKADRWKYLFALNLWATPGSVLSIFSNSMNTVLRGKTCCPPANEAFSPPPQPHNDSWQGRGRNYMPWNKRG